MACPTCNQTMQSLNATVWYCPACGTLKWREGAVEVPRLYTALRQQRDALKERVMHHPNCRHWIREIRECTCGLDALLAEIEAERTEAKG